MTAIPRDDLGRLPLLGDRVFRGSLGISLGFHVGVVLLFSLLGLIPRGRTVYAPTYMVDLVSLPPSPAALPPAAADRSASPPATPGAAATAAGVPAKAVRPAPTFLPVKASSPDREDLAALDRSRRRAELEKAIAAQSTRLASSNLSSKIPTALPRLAPLRPAAGAQGPQGSSSPVNLDLRLKSYYDRVWEKIRNSWNLPEGVRADDQALLAVVGIRILPAGLIEKVWLEKGSGNIYFDQSAIRAAQKANPLPPLPAEAANGPLEVGVNFRPSE